MTTVLETPRLLLRELVPADIDFVADMLAHPDVSFYYERQFARADAQVWLDRQLERYRRDGHGLWLAVERATAEPVGQVGLTVGLTLTVIHLISIPIDNTSVNPARSLATAVFQGSWALSQLWVFIVFPIVGGILGAAIWKVLRPESDEDTLEESEEVAPGPFGKRDMPGQ